jgi:phospho-N-acetylmuramoyl-pentapeptide-transferase
VGEEVTNILIAGTIALVFALFGTPIAVKSFRRRGWGQLIREEGPKAHYEKRGTPTMGGLVILGATVAGYALGHIGTTG